MKYVTKKRAGTKYAPTKQVDAEYDPIKHARILAKESGVCNGPVECSTCFRRSCGRTTIGCSPEDAYEDALRFLEEKDNGRKCVSIW